MNLVAFHKRLLILSLSFFVYSCGGGSSDKPSDDKEVEKSTFMLTSDSSMGGNITPATVTVEENKAMSFVVTPEQGYRIDSVSGCSGTLVDNTFKISLVTASCHVTATFEPIPSITGNVADGYLVGAKVCLDLNSNGLCNDDEPYAITVTNGEYSIDVTDIDDYEDYPMAVEVPSTAIDEDTNEAVGSAYTLSAPAGRGEFISPITTLVNSLANGGMPVETAAAEVMSQLAVSSDLDVYADYVQEGMNGNEGYKKLHEVAGVVAQIFAENEESLSIVRQVETKDVITQVETEFSNKIISELKSNINNEESTPQLSINLDEVILNNPDIILTGEGSTVVEPPIDDGITTTQSLTFSERVAVEKGINADIHINDGDKYSTYFTVEEESDVFVYFTDPSNSLNVQLEKCNSADDCYSQGDMVRVRTRYEDWKVIERANATELPTGNLTPGTYKLTFSEYSFFSHNDIDIAIKVIGYPHNRFRLDQKLLGPDVFVQDPVIVGESFDLGFGYSRTLVKNKNASNLQVVPIKLTNTGGFSRQVQFEISANFDSTKLQDIEVSLFDSSFLNFYEAVKEQDYEFGFAGKSFTSGIIWNGRVESLNSETFIFTNGNYSLDEYYLVFEVPSISEIPFEIGKENFFDNPLNSINVKTKTIDNTISYNFSHDGDVYQIQSADFYDNYDIYYNGIRADQALWQSQETPPFLDMVLASKSLNRILAFNERAIAAFYQEYTNTIDIIDNRQLIIDIASTSASLLTLIKKPDVKGISSLTSDILFTVLKNQTISTVKDVGAVYMQIGYDLLVSQYQPYKSTLVETINNGGALAESVYLTPDEDIGTVSLEHIAQLHRLQQVAEHLLRKGMEIYMSQTKLDAKWSDHIETLIGMYFGAVADSDEFDLGKAGKLAGYMLSLKGAINKAQTGADFLNAMLELDVATPVLDILDTDNVLNYYSTAQQILVTSELLDKNYMSPQNTLPTANAGDDQVIDELTTVTLNGSDSFDIEDDLSQTPLTYTWVQIDSSGYDITLDDSHAVNPTFNAPDVTEETLLTFELTVTDSQQASTKDSVDIFIVPTSTESLIFKGLEYKTVVSPITGLKWLDRNLGAKKVCTSTTDIDCYGDYFQWGRKGNGHEKADSAIDYQLIETDTAQHDKFIVVTSEPFDWRATRSDSLWSGSNAPNNPCPIGYRVPTITELTREVRNPYVFDENFLKIPAAGGRSPYGLFEQGSRFRIWSSVAGRLYQGGLEGIGLSQWGEVESGGMYRSTGQSVRCIESEEALPDEEGLDNLNAIALDDLAGHVVVARSISDDGLYEAMASVFYQETAYQQALIEEKDQDTQEIEVDSVFLNTLFGWTIVGNTVEFNHTTFGNFSINYNDSEINLNESTDAGTIKSLYKTTQLVTDNLAGYRFTFLGTRQNVYFDFQSNGVLQVIENGAVTELLWEYDDQHRLFIGDDTAVNYVGTYDEFNSGMTILGGFLLNISSVAPAADETSFDMLWRVGADDTITIPVNSNYSYDYNVDWGDGSRDTGVASASSHIYASAGDYTVKISGTFPGIQFADNVNCSNLIDISQWGDIQWETMDWAFAGCHNVTSTAVDTPNLSAVKSMSYMFYQAYKFDGDVSKWDVSHVTTFNGMFYSASTFNGDLSLWNVSNATDINSMFANAIAFKGDISSWAVSNVEDMSYFLYQATGFTGDVSGWDTSNVTNMFAMFASAEQFTSDLSSWDVSNVTDMGSMFSGAKNFESDLSNWNVGKNTNLSSTFSNAHLFNSNLSSWDVSAVNSMYRTFSNALSLDTDLSNWDVNLVTEYSYFSTGSLNVIEPIWPSEAKVYLDISNSLIWQDDSNVIGTRTWEDAENLCQQMNSSSYGGYTGWRLPTLSESESLFDAYPSAWPKRDSKLANYEMGKYWYDRAATSSYGFVYDYTYGSSGLTYTSSAYSRCVTDLN